MTKLDRAAKKEHDLGVLSRFYKSENITSTDLFDLLKRVTQVLTQMQNCRNRN
jgi:hypothetical protein